MDPDDVLEVLGDDGRVLHRVPFRGVVDKGLEVLDRQLLRSSREEVERLVRLLRHIDVLPSYQHVERRARELGITNLTSRDLTKLTWLLRGLIQVLAADSEDGSH
jgi:hypothetical protein